MDKKDSNATTNGININNSYVISVRAIPDAILCCSNDPVNILKINLFNK